MTDHILTEHRAVQTWVSLRRGTPAVVPGHTKMGRVRTRLALKFEGPARPINMPAVDQGMSPVSWSAWLSEFDRQQLALRVLSDDEFELIHRKDLN
jgi:hypothetical protein